MAAGPAISVPTVTLDAELDPFTAPDDGASYRRFFTDPYRHHTLRGVGHHLPQEAPGEFARAVVEADRI